MNLRWVISIAMALIVLPVHGVQDVSVLALFPNKAMLEIDGQRRVLANGETSPEGVTLIDATPHQATLSWNGVQHVLALGTAVNANYQRAEKTQVRIMRDPQGSYLVDGLINGKSARFLVDTGANMTAISEKLAKQLGIDYKRRSTPVKVQTAGGVKQGSLVRLSSLQVGNIKESDVHCVVVEGEYPRFALLGMNFLSRLDMKNQQGMLVLT
ncbi:MAG: retropepsin-like aspartic protease family protein, partial [bacterium]